MSHKPDNQIKLERGAENREELPGLSLEEVRASIEALLYASADPISMRSLKKVLQEAPDLINDALASLKEIYEQSGRGVQLIEVAGGWQITTRAGIPRAGLSPLRQPAADAAFDPGAGDAGGDRVPQPATIPEIMELRGVRSAGVVRTLLERKLVKIVGRKKVRGPPAAVRNDERVPGPLCPKNVRDLPQLKDMSEVFGDEVAQQLETLDLLDEAKEQVEIRTVPGV